MSKGGASVPSTPSVDPTQLAKANAATAAFQAQSLNNINTTSPFGSSTYSYTGTGPYGIGPGSTSLNQSLSPQLQPVYNNQTSLAATLAGNANSLSNDAASRAHYGAEILDRANNLTNEIPQGPVSTEGLPGIISNVAPQAAPPSIATNNVPALATSFGTGPIQTGLNFSGLTPLPTSTTDFSNEVGQAQKAAYNTQEGYLQPQQAEQTSDFQQQMADQGIAPGTAAYSRAYGDLSRAQTFQNQQAQDAAVAAGNQEQSTLYGENLSSRQQGAGELEAGGAFANAAEEQAAQQAQANAQLADAANSQQFGQNAQQAGYQAGVAQQNFGQGVTNAQLSDTANQQGFNERVTQWGEPLSALNTADATGEGILGSAAGDQATLSPMSNFAWAGAVPTFGGAPTTVTPPNIVGGAFANNQAAMNQFTAATTLNNQLFNGIGSLGGALGLGNGGLGSMLGLTGSGGLFSGLFGGGAAAGDAAGLFGDWSAAPLVAAAL